MKPLWGNPLNFPRRSLSAWILALGTTLALAFQGSAQSSLEAPFTRITSGPIATDAVTSLSAAWGDPDNDGWLDLFVGNQYFPDDTTNRLYRNNRDGTFSRPNIQGVTTDPSKSAHASAWVDYNNDGWQDLFVVNLSTTGNYFYRNTGDGAFDRMTAAQIGPIASDKGYSVATAWADYDGDGFLDLFIANGALILDERDWLYHNNGGTRFTRANNAVTAPVGQSTQGTWSDFDNDGDVDLFVTHSGDQVNSLFRNDGFGVFVDATQRSGLTHRNYGTGAVWGDDDNDGDLDLFVTSMRLSSPNLRNLFYKNRGDGSFERITTGVIAEDQGQFLSSAWIDYDNDGWLDLFVTVPSESDTSPTSIKNRLYHNLGDGTFAKATHGALVTDHGSTGGAAWGDYDNDGFLDVFVCYGSFSVNTNALYHNNGDTNNSWIKIRCVGTVSNRSAIGTKVRAKARIGGVDRWQMRQITGSEGWLSFNSLEALIGLGDAPVIDTLRIEWPSGIVQEIHHVPVKQTLTVVESTILSVEREGADPSQVRIQGPRQQRYRLETSTDLMRWLPAASLTITNVEGTVTHPISSSAAAGRDFFRAVPE